MNFGFWQKKRVLVTGHTGFKGGWLALWLKQLGANVTGYALAQESTSLFNAVNLQTDINSIVGDIRDFSLLARVVDELQPEVVFHLAAQPLVRYSYQHPLETYETNVLGTLHVLEAVRAVASVRSVVVVTTDKCYENKEWLWPYRENEALGGYDPYSSSKACAELATASYRASFFDITKVGIATARAGNVIGGGDFSVDRLIPDFVRSLQNNEKILLRYPEAIRPWQHVLEPLYGYLLLAEKLYHEPKLYSEAWNFGPRIQDTKTVAEVVDILIQNFGQGAWQKDSVTHPHEARVLKLDCSKAESVLKWVPKMNIHMALAWTAAWFKAFAAHEDMKAFSQRQIEAYMGLGGIDHG